MKAFFSLQHRRHGLHPGKFKYGFPPVNPIMPQQGLHNTGSPDLFLSFRLFIQFIDNRIDVAGIIGKMHYRVRPVKQSLEFPVFGNSPTMIKPEGPHPQNIGCRFRSDPLSSPAGQSVLVDDEIPAPFCYLRQQGPVLHEVNGLISGNAIVEIEQAVFRHHFE